MKPPSSGLLCMHSGIVIEFSVRFLVLSYVRIRTTIQSYAGSDGFRQHHSVSKVPERNTAFQLGPVLTLRRAGESSLVLFYVQPRGYILLEECFSILYN